jgi:hypothetical protein
MKRKGMDRNVVNGIISAHRMFPIKKPGSHILLSVLTLLVMAGCASTKVTGRDQLVTGQLPRPQHIWVYDFVATAADVPPDSTFAGQYAEHTAPQTPEEIAAGREVGAQIAVALVDRIFDMGLPVARASNTTKLQLNDIIFRGYLLSIEEGSAAKRFAIGFGSGTSQLRTAVEGFQVTTQGLRKLGSGTLDSGGSKGPGTAASLGVAIATGNPVGLIVSSGVKVYGEASGKSKIEGRAADTAKEIAEHLKKRFQEQGWVY